MNYSILQKEWSKILKMYRLLFLVISISCIFTSGFILLDQNRPDYYNLLPLVPLSFLVANILLLKRYEKIFNNLAIVLIFSLYFVRNVLTPFIMRLGEYTGGFTIVSNKSAVGAITIMIYESLVVFGVIYYLTREKKENKEKKKRKIKIKVGLFEGLILLIAIVMIISYIKVPEIKQLYMSILGEDIKNINYLNTDKLVNRGGLERILFTLYDFLFNFMRIFIPTGIMILIKKKIKNENLAVIASLFVISSQLLFIGTETILPIIIMAVLIILLFKLYPNKQKPIMIIFGSVICFGGIMLFVIKMKQAFSNNSMTLWASLSKMMQSYFPGVCNLAGIFNVPTTDKWTTLFYDFYYTIPFRNTLFGLTGDKLVSIFNRSNGVMNHILPCVAQGYYYLGFLAPIVPALFVTAGIKVESKRNREDNVFKYVTYTFLLIYIGITPILYNATIFGSRFFTTIVPMIIIAWLSSDIYTFSNLKSENRPNEKDRDVKSSDLIITKIKHFMKNTKGLNKIHDMGKKIYFYYWENIKFWTSYLLRKIGIDKYNFKKIKQYKNIHDGRCFIVATGPSLTVEDLKKLENEKTIGMNSLCKIFEELGWETTYFGIQDHLVFDKIKGDLVKIKSSKMFVGKHHFLKDIPEMSTECCRYPLNILNHNYTPTDLTAKFSGDCFKAVYDGYTIAYSLVQIAVYMGFKEIYLIGTDCNYDKDVNKRHFIETGVDDHRFATAGERMIFAYEEAKKYADSHGVKIYNATRGGMLEVFPRVDLDEVLGVGEKNEYSVQTN